MSPKQSELLAPQYISLDIETTSIGEKLTHGIVFELTQDSLPTLLAIKSQGLGLKFSRPFMLAWQRYALFQDNTPELRRTWSFTLTYETQAILHTLITRDGEVTNQVCADILSHGILRQQLQEVHTWLMAQLFQKLTLRQPRGRWINQVAWGGAIAVVCILALCFISLLLKNPLLILPTILMIGVLKVGLGWVLCRYLDLIHSLLVRQLLWGKFSGDRNQQLKGLQYLHRL